MIPSSSMEHHMKVGSSNKNASDQILCYKNQEIDNLPLRSCDQQARDGAVALM